MPVFSLPGELTETLRDKANRNLSEFWVFNDRAVDRDPSR